MHLVLGAGASPSGLYTAGDPTTGTRATKLDARDFNTLILELANLVGGAGIALNESDNSQVLKAVQLIARGNVALRNAILNGDFRLCQEYGAAGSTCSGFAKYVADQWISDSGNAGVATITRQTFTSGDAPGVGRFYLRHAQTTGSDVTRKPSLVQRIEGVNTLAGKHVFLSLWAKTNVGALSIQPNLRQYFGAASSEPEVNTLLALSPAISTVAWTRYSWEFDLPAVPSSATLYSVVDDYLELKLSFPAIITGNIEIADVQLEVGALTDFERRLPQLELELCQRYFEKSWEPETAVGTATYLGAAMGEESGTAFSSANTRFRVPKLKVPTVNWYTPNNGSLGNVYWNSADRGIASQSYESRQATGFPVITASQTNSKAFAHWTASARL